MTSRTDPKASNRAAKAPNAAPTSTSNPYSPSVPISLYREVSAELQAARATIASLTTQNQQLTQQNQQLHQEIEKVVQVALQLRQYSKPTQSHDRPIKPAKVAPEVKAEVPPPAAKVSTPDPTPAPNVVDPAVLSETLFTEQSSLPHQATAGQRPDGNSWWLPLIILLVVITTFGTGFVVVRSLLSR